MIVQAILAFLVLLPGMIVLVSKRNEAKTLTFFFLTLFASVWVFTNALVDRDYTNVSVWVRLTFFSTILALVFLFEFLSRYPGRVYYSHYLKIFLYSLATAIIFLLPSGYLINSVDITADGTEIIETGSLYFLVIFYYVFVIGLVMHALYEQFKIADSSTRTNVRYVFVSILLMLIIGTFTNLLLPFFFQYNDLAQYGGYSSLIFSFGVGYAILRQNMFNIRAATARSVSYLLSLSVLVLVISLSVFVTKDVLKIDSQSELQDQAVFVMLSMVVIIIFQPLKKVFDKATNTIFYHDGYDSQQIINEVNSIIVNNSELQELLNGVAKTLSERMKLQLVEFYVEELKPIDFHVAGTNSMIFASKHWESILKYLDGLPEKVVSREDIEQDKELKESFNALAINTVIRMESGNQKIGYLIGGVKRSGNRYAGQDFQLLVSISDVVSIATQNSLRLREIERFNETLQENIKSATKELQYTNQKLRSLDDAKDEFISMASHQLRTPLTSIKGYISMLLEGDAGDINEQQKQFLNQAFISSQRMVYLIADLLNVSRLKTGKFVIEPSEVYLPDVVKSEIDQLASTAEARGLTLVYDLPQSCPTLNLDETKTRQVIMNFADNAIYYTKKGGTIRVAVTASGKTVKFTVTDNGIGVPKSEQHKLFTKFYRAGNAKKARPDGTGLGLYMAKKVIVAQGGAIIFKTTEGKGSTFGFSFPVTESADSPADGQMAQK